MKSFAGVAKMIPGIACQINANQITQVEKRFKKNMKRLKKNMAMIGSLVKKEIGNLELFVKDRSCQSRLRRITADSRTQDLKVLPTLTIDKLLRNILNLSLAIHVNQHSSTTNITNIAYCQLFSLDLEISILNLMYRFI